MRFNRITLIEISSLAIILFVSIRTFLLGNGFYEYADQYWSINPGINSFAAFNPDNGFIFTRTIISWPVFFFEKLPSLLGEKVTLLYLIAFYFIISYVCITTIRRLLENNYGKKLKMWQRLLFFYISFLFIFANIESQNLFVDGGMVTDNIIMVMMILSFFLIFFNTKLWFLKIAAFLSITVLLDPDYLMMFLLLIVLTSLASFTNGVKLRRSLAFIFFSFLLMLPALYFIAFNIDISTGAFLLKSTGLRQFSPSSALFYSRNMNILSVLSLNGHNWSTMVFTAPSILTHISALGSLPGIGNPIDILVVPGPVYYSWYISLFVPLIVSILNLMYRRTLNVVSAAFFLLIISVTLSLYAYITPFVRVVEYLVKVPYFGSYISTAISLPGHFLMLVSVSYAILIMIFTYSFFTSTLPYIMVKLDRMKIYMYNISIRFPASIVEDAAQNGRRRSKYQILLSIALVGLLLFSGWQVVEGDFFPARDNAFGPTLSNGLVDSAPFEPRNLTPIQLKVYNYIYNENGSFNIFWPAITWPSGQGWVTPKPEAQLGYLPMMIENNLTNDVYYYLKYSEVRYVVLQNNSNIGFTGSYRNLLALDFGLGNFDSLVKFFGEVPNLYEKFDYSGLKVFEVNNSASTVDTNYIPMKISENTNYSSFFGIFGSMGLSPVLLSNGNYPTASIGNSSVNINIVRPNEYIFPINTVDFSHNGHLSTSLLESKNTLANFTLTNWGGNSSMFTVDGENLDISGRYSSISSVSFNGNMVSKPAGFPILPATDYILSVSFNVASISNVSYLGISWFGWGNGVGNELQSTQLINSTGNKIANFSASGNEFTNLDARIIVVGDNYTAVLNDINFTLYAFPTNSGTPFGYYSIINGSAHISTGKKYADIYLLMKGNGTLNGLTVNSETFNWIRIPSGGNLSFDGKFGLAAMVEAESPFLVLEVRGVLMNQYVPYLIFENSTGKIFGFPTVNSLAFYAVKNLGNLHLVYYDESLMGAYYGTVVAEIAVLLIVSLCVPLILKRHKMKRRMKDRRD